jgi:hypothetical protein
MALPHPNQIDDHKQHVELGQKAGAATRRGQELLKAGKRSQAQAALAEAEEFVERQELLTERWKR